MKLKMASLQLPWRHLVVLFLVLILSACQAKKSSSQNSLTGNSGSGNPGESSPEVKDTATSPDDATCGPFRLDEKQPDGSDGSMQHVQVHDQGPFGICYGEVASQLNDAYRFGALKETNTGLQTAVLGVVIGGDEGSSSDPYEGGSICGASNYIKANGYSDAFSVKKCILEKEKTLSMEEPLKKLYDDYQNDTQAMTNPDDISQRQSKLTQDLKNTLIAFGVQTQDQPTDEEILFMLGLKKKWFVGGIDAFQCFSSGKHYTSSIPSCTPTDMTSIPVADRKAKIDAVLAQLQGLPLGISYCDQVLLVGASYAGYTMTQTGPTCAPRMDESGQPIEESGRHASMIIGRRKDPKTNQCQYLVRNSWGPNCKDVPEHDQLPDALMNGPEIPPSLKSKTNAGSIYASDWTCENGNIWVDIDVLTKSIYGVSFLSR